MMQTIKRLPVLFIALFITICGYGQEGFVHEKSSNYQWPTDSATLKKLDKWQDLKFGVLFHWGLYSVPGIVESWSICSEDQDWIPRDSTIAYTDYKEWYWNLKDEFNPTDFDPAQWSRICKEAGMKYSLFTTKHHDGFCLWDTQETDFSIMNGPFGKDPRADLAKGVFDAFRNDHFMVGAYFSKPDWNCEYYWWPRYATATRNVNYNIKNHPAQWEKFQKFTYNQIQELMNEYGSIDILWLDGGWVAAPRQDIKMDEIAAMARKAQPGLLIVDRLIHGPNENYQTPERSIPNEQLPNPWESCIPLSDDWGWTPEANFKSSQTIVANLIEIVAKGGCLALGVGPTPQGLIQPEVETILSEIGSWLKQNGKAIYETRTLPYYQSENVWFTQNIKKKETYAIYALAEDDTLSSTISWEGNLPEVGSTLRLVSTGEKLKYSIEGNKVKVKLPRAVVDKQESFAISYPTISK